MQPKFKVKVLLTQIYNKSTPYLLTMKCAINVPLLHFYTTLTTIALASLGHLWFSSMDQANSDCVSISDATYSI